MQKGDTKELVVSLVKDSVQIQVGLYTAIELTLDQAGQLESALARMRLQRHERQAAAIPYRVPCKPLELKG